MYSRRSPMYALAVSLKASEKLQRCEYSVTKHRDVGKLTPRRTTTEPVSSKGIGETYATQYAPGRRPRPESS